MQNIVVFVLLFLTIILAFNYVWLIDADLWFTNVLRGNEFLHLFHFFGDTSFAILVLILSIGIVIYQKLGYRLVAFIILNYGLMLVVNRVLKYIIERPRLEIVGQLTSYSMPSGHTMASLTFALVTAYLWKTIVNKWNKSASFILIACAVLCGLSRIADERHFFTDVLVGWSLSWIIYYFIKKWYEKGRL